MLDHLADLESDFSVFHRVDDMYQLDGPRFFRLAWRIAAYDGMVTRQIAAQNADPEPAPARAEAPATPVRRAPSDNRLPVAAMALAHPGLFEIARVTPDPSE